MLCCAYKTMYRREQNRHDRQKQSVTSAKAKGQW